MKQVSIFSQADNDDSKMRIDKWPWSARFLNTRSLVIDAGNVLAIRQIKRCESGAW